MSRRSKANRGADVGRLKRALIIAAYDGRCWICGSRPETVSLDHIVPRVDGGTLDVENLRPACPRCNVARDRRLRAMAGRGRRTAIAKELSDTWHQAFPLPRFDEHGAVVDLDPALRDRLPIDLVVRCFPRQPERQAVAA